MPLAIENAHTKKQQSLSRTDCQPQRRRQSTLIRVEREKRRGLEYAGRRDVKNVEGPVTAVQCVQLGYARSLGHNRHQVAGDKLEIPLFQVCFEGGERDEGVSAQDHLSEYGETNRVPELVAVERRHDNRPLRLGRPVFRRASVRLGPKERK